MKYFDMFTGVGGFTLGIEQAYDYSNKQTTTILKDRKGRNRNLNEEGGDVHNRSNAPLCIGFSEIDKYASQLLSVKWPNIKNYGNATLINEHELPDFDLLVGGFPCQSFSIAGKRKGFDDTRGTLFFDIARILTHKKPEHLVLENVKGLLSHDGGNTFQTIIRVLTDLGYFIEWQVLNSKNFGVPQNRERVFIVGHLGGTSRPKVFPVGQGDGEDIRKVGEQVSYAIDASYYKGINTGLEGGRSSFDKMKRQMVEVTKNVSDAERIYKPEGVAKTLKGLGGGLGAKTGMYQMGDLQVRRLTPVECERLQGFPDGWTEGFSDTQRYKMMGNAVTVNVVEYVISKLVLWK